MAKYHALVGYSYVNSYNDDFGMRSETLSMDIRPNTPSGLKTIGEILAKEHPTFKNISVITLTPMAEDPKKKDIEEEE